MRTAILTLLLAVSYAVNETTPATTGGDQQQLGGCKLRCRKLTFIGEGSVPVKPNWALLSLSVEVDSNQLQGGQGGDMSGNLSGKVRDEIKKRSTFILNYLKDLSTSDLKDLQTEEMSFQPDFDHDDKSMDYKAIFGLSFKVKIDKFQEVLDRLVSDSGANRVDSIVFVADDDVEQQAHIKAIELATSNAWKQAQAVSKVLGIQGNLKLLSVRDRLQPIKRLMRRFARRMNMGMGGMGMGGMGMGNDFDDSDDFGSNIANLQDQIVNALLVFQFDFEDGTINFKEVQPIENNITVSDAFGGLLGGQNASQPISTQPQPISTQPQSTAQPTLVLPNNTAAMKPGETMAVQPVTTQPPP